MNIKIVRCACIAALVALSAAGAGAWDVPPEDWDNQSNPNPTPNGTPGEQPVKTPATAKAEPAPGEKRAKSEVHPGGLVVLPTTGIRVELQVLSGGSTYRVSGRWGLSDTDGSWSRDVIDEVQNGRLTGATWYYVGPFKNGSCREVLDTHGLADAWRTTATYWGQSFEVAGGSFIFTNGDLGTRPAVVLCGGTAEHPMLFYRFFFEAGDPTALPKDTLLARIATIPVLKLIAEAHVAGRWSRVKPLHADSVGTNDLLEYQRTAPLSQFSGAVTIPDDGAYWSVTKTDDSDFFSRVIPRSPRLNLHLQRGRYGTTCDSLFAAFRDSTRQEGMKSIPTLPSPEGWRAGLTYVATPNDSRTVLCRKVGAERVLVLVTHDAGLGDLAEAEPLLEAFITAIGAATQTPPTSPTPVATPKPGPKPTPSPSHSTYRDAWGGFTSVDLAVAVSYRDTKALGRSEESFPSLRVAGPGVSVGTTSFETDGGLMFRYQAGLLPDFAGLFNDKTKSSARWGAQAWEAAVDVGLGAAVGEDDVIGLTVGWHIQAGPLLINSSIAAAFHWIHMPEDPEEFGWALRVTPLQLIPANERWLMSPLSVDLRLLGDDISFGFEFQWVGKPKPGEQHIPGEGVAAFIRLGFGGFFF